MSRTLSRTVLAGGEIHPAGTPASAELEDLIPDEFWAGAKSEAKPKRTKKVASAGDDSED